MKAINSGIYPTMLVFYDQNGEIDYDNQAKLLDWYVSRGVHGVFALCHSTEQHALTLKERIALAKFCKERIPRGVSFVTSGITAESMGECIDEACAIADACDPDALVISTNRFGEGEAFYRNAEKFLGGIDSSVRLGLYECPYPYKKVLSDDEFVFLTKTKRFAFIKDTCVDQNVMRRRVELNCDENFKLFNANCASALDSFRFGYDGFSGIMANFHPDLYVWLYENRFSPIADDLSAYLGVTSLIECRSYPICCKQYLNKYEGFTVSDFCRSVKATAPETTVYELDGIARLTEYCRKTFIK